MQCSYLNWEGATPPNSSAWGRMLIDQGVNYLVLVEGDPSMTNDQLRIKTVLYYRGDREKQFGNRRGELFRKYAGQPYSAWLEQFDGCVGSKPDWDDAPEWANWVVQTCIGNWLWCQSQPVHTAEGLLVGPTNAAEQWSTAYEAPPGTVIKECEWKNSIECKPE